MDAAELVPRLRRWTDRNWAAAAEPPGTGTRAEVVAAVVQRLADLGADTEGRPRRPVPRLADTALADQLAVVVDDLRRTADPTATAALTAELAALRATLGYR